MAKKEITKPESNGTALAMADGKMEFGFCTGEGGGKADLYFPRVHIFQDVGNESQRRGDHEKGTLLNADTNEPLASARFLPIMNWREWHVWDDDGRLVQRSTCSDDFDKSDLEWGNDGSPPRAMECIVWLCLFEGETTPFTVTFNKKSFNEGKKINTLLAMTKGKFWFEMVTKKVSNDKGAWFIFSPKAPAGKVEEEAYEMAKVWYESLQGMNVVDISDAAKVEGSEGESVADAAPF